MIRKRVLEYSLTELRVRVGSTLASYSGVPGFNSGPGVRLSQERSTVSPDSSSGAFVPIGLIISKSIGNTQNSGLVRRFLFHFSLQLLSGTFFAPMNI
jgi:hypothetical protein